MTHVEIVKEAIRALERNKHIKLELLSCKDDNKGGVDTIVHFPKPWHYTNFGFTEDWFSPKRIDVEGFSWMDGFEVPDEWRIVKPEIVAILRIAYYFYKTGLDNHLF